MPATATVLPAINYIGIFNYQTSKKIIGAFPNVSESAEPKFADSLSVLYQDYLSQFPHPIMLTLTKVQLWSG